MRTFLLTIVWITSLGSVGHWILTIPILIIAPFKFVTGTIIGLWAYSVAKKMPAKPTS